MEIRLSKLKALYISAYVTFVMVASGYCMYQMLADPVVPWVAALLTTLPPALFFARAFLVGDVPRTSERIPALLVIAIFGVAIVAGGYLTGFATAPVALGIAIAGLIGWVIYSYWYSNLGRSDNALLVVGQTLPAFELQTEAGEPVSSSSFFGKPLLLMFYRGNWCPLCMAQIREIAAQYQELHERGVEVACVSPQPHENTRKLAAKFDVPFRFLVDPSNQAAKHLGIFAKDGLPLGLQALGYQSDTVLPTVVITDAHGQILFADLTDNYRVRPEPSTFLSVLDGHGVAMGT